MNMKNLLTFFAVLCMSVAINTELNANRNISWNDVGYVNAGQVFTISIPNGEYCAGYPAQITLVSTGPGYASFKFEASGYYYEDTPFTLSFGTNKSTPIYFKGIIKKNR